MVNRFNSEGDEVFSHTHRVQGTQREIFTTTRRRHDDVAVFSVQIFISHRAAVLFVNRFLRVCLPMVSPILK